MKTRRMLSLMVAGALAGAGDAQTHDVDLSVYEHGTVLNGADLRIAVGQAEHFHRGRGLLVAFDTRERGTLDPDLEGPDGSGRGWASGNLAGSARSTGIALVIQDTGPGFAGFTDASQSMVRRPDDEERRVGGTRPGAGEITLDFVSPVKAFRFTLIDIEPTDTLKDKRAYFARFSGGGQSVKVAFADFIDPASAFYDASVVFGNHSANRIQMVTAEQLGLSAIQRVVINLGGSGAVAELAYETYDGGWGTGDPEAVTSGFRITGPPGGVGLPDFAYEVSAPPGGSPGGPGGGGLPGPPEPPGPPGPETPEDFPPPLEPPPAGTGSVVPSPNAAVVAIVALGGLALFRRRRQALS